MSGPRKGSRRRARDIPIRKTVLVATGPTTYEVFREGIEVGTLYWQTLSDGEQWVYDPIDEPMGHCEWKVFASLGSAKRYLGVS